MGTKKKSTKKRATQKTASKKRTTKKKPSGTKTAPPSRAPSGPIVDVPAGRMSFVGMPALAPEAYVDAQSGVEPAPAGAHPVERLASARGYAYGLVLLPKVPDLSERSGLTFSMAAAQRATAFRASTSRSSPELAETVVQPKRRPGAVLEKLGLAQVSRAGGQPALMPKATGVYTDLSSLGLTTAFFADEKDRDDAMGDLESEYEVVPNFSLELPDRQRRQERPSHASMSALPRSEWPHESGVAQAHARGIRGARVLVGVLDTGVDADHEEFAHQSIGFRYISLNPSHPDFPPRDVRGFDPDGHGTHVCGLIGGRTVGVAPEVTLMAASVIESETVLTSMTRIVHGIDWLLRQFARPEYEDLPAIVNMSLGFAPSAPGNVNPWMYERQVRAIGMLTQALVNANVLPVIAVGNRGEGTYGLPAGFDHVLGVGAVDTELRVADFSGSGKHPGERNAKPDLVGYGVDVYSSLERDYDGRSIYTRLDGTSMAAPYVSGIAALMRCEDRFATVDEIRDKLRADALPISGQKASRVGAGLARYVA